MEITVILILLILALYYIKILKNQIRRHQNHQDQLNQQIQLMFKQQEEDKTYNDSISIEKQSLVQQIHCEKRSNIKLLQEIKTLYSTQEGLISNQEKQRQRYKLDTHIIIQYYKKEINDQTLKNKKIIQHLQYNHKNQILELISKNQCLEQDLQDQKIQYDNIIQIEQKTNQRLIQIEKQYNQKLVEALNEQIKQNQVLILQKNNTNRYR